MKNCDFNQLLILLSKYTTLLIEAINLVMSN
jgi:hypothetical protein